ncbi:MAG: G5 domain-containing protein [Parcubacteria group bacterium]|jgi:hypothetical protein
MRTFFRILIAAALIAVIIFALKYNYFWPFRRHFLGTGFVSKINLDDNGLNYFVLTTKGDVSGFLEENKIVLGEHDLIYPASGTAINSGSNIVIRRAIPVTIEVDGKKIELDAMSCNVAGALKEADIALGHADKIIPETSALLSPKLAIKITRINFEEIVNEEDIPFQTVEKEDNTVLWRKHETKQKGEKGIREKTYRITYTNGKETNRVLLGSKVTKTPVSQVEVVGTKIIVGKTQTGGATWYVNGDDLTCASLDFPSGKYLRVINRANGKSVIVQVNDSGPYGKGRIIDLNRKAFQKIGDIGAGVINVKVEEILN